MMIPDEKLSVTRLRERQSFDGHIPDLYIIIRGSSFIAIKDTDSLGRS